jgi:recombination protein RecA
VSLESALKEIEKKWPNKVMLGSEAVGLRVHRIPTGSLALDVETGGGWAQGSINEIYGDFSSGKTFILYKTIAVNQKKYPEGNFVLLLYEDFDPVWATVCGVDLNRLHIIRPTYMEDGLDIAERLIKSGDLFFLGLDSYGAMCPKAEFEADMEQNTMALKARLGNKWIRKIAGVNDDMRLEDVDLGNTTVLIINQVYSTMSMYGNPLAPPGGKAIGFFARIRVRIRSAEQVREKDGSVISQLSAFTTEKNKTFPPKRKGEFWFNISDNPMGPAGSVNRLDELTRYGITYGVIRQSGAWFYLPEFISEDKFQGKANLAEFLMEQDDSVIDQLESMVHKAVRIEE